MNNLTKKEHVALEMLKIEWSEGYKPVIGENQDVFDKKCVEKDIHETFKIAFKIAELFLQESERQKGE